MRRPGSIPLWLGRCTMPRMARFRLQSRDADGTAHYEGVNERSSLQLTVRPDGSQYGGDEVVGFVASAGRLSWPVRMCVCFRGPLTGTSSLSSPVRVMDPGLLLRRTRCLLLVRRAPLRRTAQSCRTKSSTGYRLQWYQPMTSTSHLSLSCRYRSHRAWSTVLRCWLVGSGRTARSPVPSWSRIAVVRPSLIR
jgi:hypothetical protein